ncbi:hypothetical protein [Candidatus Nanohalobium constans]|uniref:Uncharacterized protein n=1 Tax=Candidatus Nanohalobium constans TaxID=2565781 RepID=A0A5Q0UGM5_9ARCH|nr:hypothetical protein [Candidatus Nanohalobium constans]QGA80360.1 hypothetical protein LC1Nh_0459 [Candidatus Nanohalobium constans]
MDVKLTEEAIKDKDSLSQDEWAKIKDKIDEITNQLSHEGLKLISNPFLNHPIWQLTIEENPANHRAFIDVRNSQIIIIAIWDFEFTHQGDDHWEELTNRV